MPSLTRKLRDTSKYLNDAKEAVATSLRTTFPNTVVKWLGGDTTVTALQPVGDKIRFVLEFQITPDSRKEEAP